MQRIEDAEPVLARQHLHDGSIGDVDQWHVAEESVGVEDVEEQLAARIEGRVRYDQVHVEVELPESSRLPLGSRRLTPSLSSSLPRSRPLYMFTIMKLPL